MIQLAAGVLVVLAVADIFVTRGLVRAARALNEPALTERALASVILTIVASAVAVLAAAFLLGVRIPVPWNSIILIGGFMLVSVPQIVWWVAYRRGRFR
mgnify:FL=1